MPLVKVNLLKGRTAEEKYSIAASIQTALISTLEVPDADRYQLFNEYDGESFRHTSGYLGMTYTDHVSFGKGLAQRAPISQLAG
jgi:4-oxalocrotonate tautomerase